METKVSMVILSHLSDAAIEMYHNKNLANTRLMFVKYLVMNFEDTNVEIDPQKEFEKYTEIIQK